MRATPGLHMHKHIPHTYKHMRGWQREREKEGGREREGAGGQAGRWAGRKAKCQLEVRPFMT